MLLFSMLAGVESAKSTSRTITVPDDYPTIESAITNANEGDTIFVKKGVYVENPVVNKSISLVGEDRDSTVIDVTAGLKVQSNNVTITGFTIYDGWQGIEVSANCCSISGNKITNATYGVVVFGWRNNVTENIFQFIGLSAAIQLNYANNNLIKGNYIDSCTEGIQLKSGSSNNIVKENIITNCQDVAVRLLGGYSPPRWYDPSGNTIMLNNISNSGCGTTIYGSNKNVISNNNYVNNTIQFSTNEDYYLIWGGNVSVNTIKENYWSDYNGTDGNDDGIGDMPYVIDENNIDQYPLMKPVAIPAFPYSITPKTVLSPTPSPEPQPEPFPTAFVAAASGVSIAVVAVGLLVYFKKRKR
jgi:parallel beta-helix repeat protein